MNPKKTIFLSMLSIAAAAISWSIWTNIRYSVTQDQALETIKSHLIHNFGISLDSTLSVNSAVNGDTYEITVLKIFPAVNANQIHLPVCYEISRRTGKIVSFM